MVIFNRSLDKAIQFVDHMHETKNGKSNLEKCQYGFTSYASCIKQLNTTRENYLLDSMEAMRAGQCLRRNGLVEGVFA